MEVTKEDVFSPASTKERSEDKEESDEEERGSGGRDDNSHFGEARGQDSDLENSVVIIGDENENVREEDKGRGGKGGDDKISGLVHDSDSENSVVIIGDYGFFDDLPRRSKKIEMEFKEKTLENCIGLRAPHNRDVSGV